MDTNYTNVLAKISSLIYSLTHTKEEIEMVADEVDDCNLRIALNGLSQESSIFANELCMQFKNSGLYFPKLSMEELQGSNTMIEGEDIDGPGDELSYICKKNENFLMTAYTLILNENFLFPGLRDLMTYQLDALKCAFMKIKLLNMARFGGYSQTTFSL